jgi:plastocyanin
VSGATVTLSGAASRNTTTSATGAYRFEALPAGQYAVAITPPAGFGLADGQSGSKTVTVNGGGSATVDFELKPQEGSATVVEIELSGVSFSAPQVTISKGQTVRWINREAMFHTVTPDGHTEWSSASLSQVGQTFEHTFDKAGTFAYYCQPHRGAGMTGRVVVQ